MVLNRFCVTRFNDLERDYAHQEHGLHAAVGKILACKRVHRNAAYTCCGRIAYRKSCHAFAINHMQVSNSEAVSRKITIASCVVKPCVQNVLIIMIYL